jgi:hypothetical protein
MRTILCFSLFCLLGYAEDYPQVEISNGLIQAQVLLPDAEHGSYRGTRFDWSGIISRLRFGPHEYFDRWYPHHDPKIHDAITGPVEEFLTGETSLGYDEAAAGGTFVRIGIGTVRKPEEKSYRRFDTYDIVDPGKRTVRQGPNWIEFTHELRSDQGYDYRYSKTLRLETGKPRLVIEHALENTGTKVIDTFQYNHNFFVIDHETVGPDISVHFAFPPKPLAELKNGTVIRDREITYEHDLHGDEGVFSELVGFSPNPKDYDVRIENHHSGAGVRIRGDQPLAKMMFWSIKTVASAEPYVHMRIEPGKESRWTITYDFYTLP